MAGGERLGASFSIDVSDLKAGLAQANRLIKESKSEFKAAAAGMDDWRKSEDGLIAKKKELNSTLKIQEAVLDAYKKQMQEAGYAEDDMSKAAVELRTKINNQQAAINGTKKDLSKMDDALDELRSSSGDAEDALDDVGDAAKDAGKGFTVAKGAAAEFIGRGLSALAGAAKDAISSIAGLAEETREYREDMGKLETAFESAGKSTKVATKSYKDLYAVLGEEDRSVEAVNHLAKFVDTEKDMAKWTNIMTGVWGTFGDSLPIEGLTEASNETAKVGKVTGVLADALNWAGISEDDFNSKLAECSNETERAKLITETLNDTYSDAADKYKENNKSVMEARDAASEFADAQAELGEAIEPLTTQFTELKTKAIQWFIDNGLPKLEEGFGWVKDNAGTIEAGIAGIGAAFLTFKVVGIITSVTKAMEGMTLAQAALNFVMGLNPIGIVVAAIAGLVAAFVVLWKKCDGFRNFWISIWDKIKSVASSAWKNIKSVFSGVGSFFKGKFDDAKEKIKNVFSSLPEFFGNLWGKIKDKFTGLGEKIASAIGDSVKSGINGVISMIENTINGAITLINGAIKLANKLPGVNVGLVDKVDLPRLAKGGVVSSATQAIIGEDGKEAVIPLEKNTGWMDTLAEKLAEKSTGVVVNQTNNFSQAHSRYEIYKAKKQTAAAVRLAVGRA